PTRAAPPRNSSACSRANRTRAWNSAVAPRSNVARSTSTSRRRWTCSCALTLRADAPSSLFVAAELRVQQFAEQTLVVTQRVVVVRQRVLQVGEVAQFCRTFAQGRAVRVEQAEMQVDAGRVDVFEDAHVLHVRATPGFEGAGQPDVVDADIQALPGRQQTLGPPPQVITQR